VSARRVARLVLVDNYDSFTHNIAHLFGALDAEVTVLRNDDPALSETTLAAHDAICIGPGPGRPGTAGVTMATIGYAARTRTPLLGVCLGLQAIGEYFGGVVDHAPALMHGKTSVVTHDASGVFEGLASPIEATRYHSLCVAHAPFPSELRANAASDDGVVQGAVHRTLPIHGVQFHPESVLTRDGYRLFASFLAIASSARGFTHPLGDEVLDRARLLATPGARLP